MAKGSPFGQEARKKALRRYFQENQGVTAHNAWEHVYHLLLSIDRRTRLAHVMDSNHMQPGGAFHSRAVRFTDLLCNRWRLKREELRNHVDYLFKACLTESLPQPVADAVEATLEEVRTEDVASDAAQSAARSEFLAEVIELLVSQLGLRTSRKLVQAVEEIERKAEQYFTIEKKRANVRGEGFEDTLQWLLATVSGVPPEQIKVRKAANQLPGFKAALPSRGRARDKVPKPDVAVVSPDGDLTLWIISVKWSLRQDRLDQFGQESAFYAANKLQRTGMDFVLVTNEMDVARLRDVLSPPPGAGGFHFHRVYHVNVDLLQATQEARFEPLVVYRTDRRLLSLEDLLRDAEGWRPR